jgi:DNA-binding XRE family transcriptional regulator
MTFPISIYTRLFMVENGKDTPSLKLVYKIAAILDVKVEDLFKI